MKADKNAVFFLKVLVMMYIITGLILVILAAVMLKASPGSAFISGGIIFAYLASSFAGGFIMGKKKKKQKYLWGLGTGLAYFLVLFVVSLLVQKGLGIQLTHAVGTGFLCAIGGMIGGMLS